MTNGIEKKSTSSCNGEISALASLILNVFTKNDWSMDTYLASVVEGIAIHRLLIVAFGWLCCL